MNEFDDFICEVQSDELPICEALFNLAEDEYLDPENYIKKSFDNE